jgi:hypothetical protein
MEEGAAAHIRKLATVVQLPQHGDGVGGLAAVGQAEDGSPNGPMGWPVEVDLLKDGRHLDQQPSGGQDGSEHGLFGLQVVRWPPVRVGHRSQAAPGRPLARLSFTHRRGVRGLLPRRRDLGVGRHWSRMCLT